MHERIYIHPRICHGQACIAGTRIPVHQIVRMFAHGDSIEKLLSAYPGISREDILACHDYAASLAEEQVTIGLNPPPGSSIIRPLTDGPASGGP